MIYYFPLFTYLFIPSVLSLSMIKRKRRQPALKTILSRQMHCSRRRINVGDEYLAPVTSKAMGKFLVYDNTDELEWKKGVLECNTFALFFRANAKRWFLNQKINAAVGTIWTYPTRTEVGHAFNFYLLPSLRVIYVEPQTDRERFLNARVQLVVI